jgi:nitrogen regulatory protein PII
MRVIEAIIPPRKLNDVRSGLRILGAIRIRTGETGGKALG